MEQIAGLQSDDFDVDDDALYIHNKTVYSEHNATKHFGQR
jgi:hypothetical protein